MKLKTLIADESGKYTNQIKEYLLEHPNIDLKWVYDNFQVAMQEMMFETWDLIVLYVPEPTKDCIGAEINHIIAPYTILITDAEDFAKDNFDINGLDLIVPPITKQRLFQGVEKYLFTHCKETKRTLTNNTISV